MADQEGLNPDEQRKTWDQENNGKTNSPSNDLKQDGNGERKHNANGVDGAQKQAQTEKQTAPAKEDAPKKPSGLKKLWKKIDLDMGTVLMMFKGSVAPAIAIAFYQADVITRIYKTLGYLVPILTVLCLPIMPRAKYMQTLILNTIGVCIGSAIALLGLWSAIQARLHTIPPGTPPGIFYNSSQAAVCAIWLFANIWFVNVIRAKLPAFQFPVIMYSIFTNVAFTYGPLFPNMAAAESLIKELLEGFLMAFAISTGVNWFIIPVTSRTVIFKEQAGYIGLIRKTIKAQVAYLESLEQADMFASGAESDTKKKKKTKSKNDKTSKASKAQNAEAKVLKGCVEGLTELHGKLYGDMPFAKREFAYGNLDASDLSEMFTLFRGILIPLVGISTITDVFERVAEKRGWVYHGQKDYDPTEKERETRVWNEIMKTLHQPFAIAASAMDEAMEHAGLVLELLPKPKKKKGNDVEAEGNTPKPGHPEFSKYLNEKMVDFYNNRGKCLKTWAREKGLSQDQFDSMKLSDDINISTVDDPKHQRDQQQLYLILYLEHLLYSTGLAISKFVAFADKKVEDGSMRKKKLIFPGYQRLKKWVISIGKEDSSAGSDSPDSMEAGNHNIYMGSGFNPKKDPEHLPARNAWEKFGNGIRTIPRFLGSTESAFGFRVALATMTIGIVAFLKDTQRFFIEQRLVWAMIIIAIGMTMTSGQSVFGFFARVAGTALAMVFSIVIWYIVDEKTPGIIVMLWFFIFIEFYFFLKFPRFIPVWLVTIVTQVLILGYELQVRKIGIEAASATGQPYYPIYELAPYRLACVAGGSFVAFIWTIFPYPLSDRSWLRKDLGSTLYLLANYYSIVHATIRARMHDTEGDLTSKHSPGHALEKVRHKVFAKLMLLIPSLTQHSEWQKWEPTIGGKFPRETYEGIIKHSTHIMHYLSLLSYASTNFTTSPSFYPNTNPATRRQWLNDLTRLIDNVSPTSHQVTSTLSLLSASVRNGSALPPYIRLPQPYDLTRKLEKLDKGILDARHVEEPGYSAYAVMQVASTLLLDDLEQLVEHVKDLVGETDFTFQVPMSETSFESTGSDDSGKGKRD